MLRYIAAFVVTGIFGVSACLAGEQDKNPKYDYNKDREIVDSQKQVPKNIRDEQNKKIDQLEELDRLEKQAKPD